VLDEVEQRLLGPVQVIDHHCQWRSLFQQLAERPGDLLGRGWCIVLTKQRRDRGSRGRLGRPRTQLLQHLHHRPVRDPLPVRQAAAPHDPGVDFGEALGDETRLADARISDHGDELAGGFGGRALPRISEHAELA